MSNYDMSQLCIIAAFMFGVILCLTKYKND